MKQYPSIPSGPPRDALDCHGVVYAAFDKIDGSNIRAEWSKKRGWYKFGTRHRLVDATDPIFGRVPEMFNEQWANDLDVTLRNKKYESAVCFFEFWGPNSLCGNHDPNDEKRLTLIDVAPFKKGIMTPDEFLDTFGTYDHAHELYRGKITPELLDSIRSGQLEGMTFEGVVFKALNDKHVKRLPAVFKVKNHAWYAKLREMCKGDEKLYAELA